MKIIIYLCLIINISFSCALCQLQIPIVGVNLEIKETNSSISWLFSKEFSKEIIDSFDENQNKNLDKNELKKVEQSLKEYLENNHFLTKFFYYENSNKIEIDLNVSDDKFDFDYLNEHFSYEYRVDYKSFLDREIVSIEFKDEQNFFDFKIESVNLEIIDKEISKNIFLNHLFLNLKPKDKIQEIIKSKEKQESIEDSNNFYQFLQSNIKNIIEKIKFYLNDIKENSSIISILSLLLFSFIYGILHALGPGHGKSLVASYFLSNNKSYAKALSISTLIAIVHTFSAFTLTVVIYFFIKSFLSSFISDVTLYTSKISAITIISIALYLIYKKLKSKVVIRNWSNNKKNSFILQPKQPHSHSCSCNSCNTKSTDLGIILSAGIIPCPGTVTIFIFTISIELYFIGFLSALFMSIGMSIIILLSAILSIKIKKSVDSRFQKLAKILEYLSLFIILILGISLFFLFN